MSIILRNRAAALGVAGALALGFAVSAGPALAAPVATNTAALKQIDVGNVVDVQWRHRSYRRNAAPWVAGAALGIIGGVIASQAYQNSYYGYGYEQYPYGAPYQGGYYGGYEGGPYGYAYAAPNSSKGYYGGYTPYYGYAPLGSDCDNATRC